nr:hypothetical protein [Tanacetum cinerariifolium]
MDGMNFTRWKEKMKFLLTAFKNSLEKKYTAEKEGTDKFITFKFFEFAMEDNVSILDQVYEFLVFVSKFKNLNIEIPEKLLVGAIITKLPSSWHNYRKKLMHTSEDFTLDQIQKHLRIEEETRIWEKNLNGASSSKVNYVDSGKNNKEYDKKRKGTWNSSKDNKKDKKPLSEVACYKCGKKEHIKRYCKNPIRKNQNSNKKDESANAKLHMASVIITDDWWYDSGATTHVYNNRDLFKTYKETEDGHEVIIGDNHTSNIIGSGNMEIQFTYGKKLTLMNVLHVPNIRKNLVSGFKLCKSEVKAVIESDKAFETFKIYKAEVENQKGKKIQILKSDRGGEYFSTEFSSYYESQGLIHQRTAPYTPQQNGVAKRKNKVLQDMINVMLVSANLPKNLWGEALLIACHRLKEYIVGYAKDSKSYRCLDLDSNVIVESRDVDFFENKFRCDLTSTNEIATQIPQDISGPNLNSNNKRNMAESSSAPRRSERARKERNLDPDFIDSQAIIFLVEGDNENNVINKIPVLLNIYLQVPKQLGVDGYLELNTIQMDPFKLSKLDDILIVRTNMKGINETKKFLSSCFQMKDMNEVDTILGIKVKRHSGGYALNQCHYIDKIIDKFQHLNIKEANTSYESSCKHVKNDGRAVTQIEYTVKIYE